MPFTTQMGPYNQYGGPMTGNGTNPFFMQGQWAGMWGQRPQGFGSGSAFDYFNQNPTAIGQYWGQHNALANTLRSVFPNYGMQYPSTPPPVPGRPANPIASGTLTGSIAGEGPMSPRPTPTPIPQGPNNPWQKFNPSFTPNTNGLPQEQNFPRDPFGDPKPYGGGLPGGSYSGGIGSYRGRGWF